MKPDTLLLVMFAALAALPSAATADMYTWKDPQTGGTRMSNLPPPWLREGQRGPRVEVIRENKVIDAGAAFATPQPPAEMSPRQRAMARLPERDVPAAVEKPGDEEEDR